jgi:hypothetical protein
MPGEMQGRTPKQFLVILIITKKIILFINKKSAFKTINKPENPLKSFFYNSDELLPDPVADPASDPEAESDPNADPQNRFLKINTSNWKFPLKRLV